MEGVLDDEEGEGGEGGEGEGGEGGVLVEGVGDGREFSLFGERKDLWVLPKIRKKQLDLEEGREGGKGEE